MYGGASVFKFIKATINHRIRKVKLGLPIYIAFANVESIPMLKKKIV